MNYLGVLDLDDKTFNKVITGDTHAFVEFYAPWCGHCKEFKNTFDEVAESMGDLPNLILAKVHPLEILLPLSSFVQCRPHST